MALSEQQKCGLPNTFTMLKPEALGLTYAQFHELKNTMANQPPQVMLKEIKRKKRKNDLQQKLRDQKSEEKMIGFKDSVVPSYDTMTRKVDLMYPDDIPHSQKSILCKSGHKKSNKKRGRLQIMEGSPERRHYVPGHKIRPQQECVEPEKRKVESPPPPKTAVSRIKSAMSRICKPMMACSGTSLGRTSASRQQNLTPPRKCLSPATAGPSKSGSSKAGPSTAGTCRAGPSKAREEVYCTPPRQRLPCGGIPKPKLKPITKAEEDKDKDILLGYLNTIPISRNTPLDILKKVKPGSVIEIID